MSTAGECSRARSKSEAVLVLGSQRQGPVGQQHDERLVGAGAGEGCGGVGLLVGRGSVRPGSSTLASRSRDGSVWCWGLNGKGQSGNNTTNDSLVPVQVKGAGGVGTLTTRQRSTAVTPHRAPGSLTTRFGVGVATTKVSWATTRPTTRRCRCRSRVAAGQACSPTRRPLLRATGRRAR